MFEMSEVSSITPMDDIPIYDPHIPGIEWTLPVTFNLDMLDMFCSYAIDVDNIYIPHMSLVNLKTLFDLMDKRPYNNNDNLKARIEFVNTALEARLDKRLDKLSLILNYIKQNSDNRLIDIIENDIIPELKEKRLSSDVSKYINTMVYEHLVDGYSVVYSKKIVRLLEKKEAGRYKRMSDYNKDFKKLMAELELNIKKSEEFVREGRGFDLSEKSILSTVKKYVKELKSPTNKLKLGIQYLNRMLNGGLEAGRSYLFMGSTGAGKSIVLLSIANWIRNYNIIPKKKGYTDAVLFISQENSGLETWERMFNMNVTKKDIINMTDDEIINGMRNAGMIVKDNDKDTINFIFKYYSNQEIGVQDIDALIEDYERNGVRIIAVVQDYIERLKPKSRYSEMRYVLGSIATELSELAKKWQIPVVSAAQLNRMATSVTDNAIANNKKNTTKLLGKAFISESWDMMKNIDASIIINPEYDVVDGVEKKYLGFKLEKFRGKPNKDKLYLFIHPFEEDNGALLIPDINTKPVSGLSMEDFNPFGGASKPVVNVNPSPTFMSSFIDMVDEDFTDDNDSFTDICKKAEEFSNNMKLIHEREKEIRRKFNEKIKADKYDKAVKISRKRDYECNENGAIIIRRKDKQNIA